MANQNRKSEIRIVERKTTKSGNYGKLCTSTAFREEFANICSYSLPKK